MKENDPVSLETVELKERQLARFGQLFDKIFTNHRREIVGRDSLLNPINLEEFEAEERRKLGRRQERQKQLFGHLSEVMTAIDKDGGITEEVYKQHKAAINRFVREWLKIGGTGYNADSEDRLDQPATAEVLKRYPEDGIFDTGHEILNIFGSHRRKEEITAYNPDEGLFVHSDEGIMWYR